MISCDIMSLEMKAKFEKEQAVEKKKREDFRKKIIKKIGEFIDGTEKRQEFPSMDKVSRAIIHEVAETAGLISHAFGTDEEENRHVIIFKKEYPPSEEELQVLRKGESTTTPEATVSVDTKQNPLLQAPQYDYRDKYKHLIATEISEPSAIKTEPGKHFGFVPSANKRDLRSIEETLKDIKSKKRIKLTVESDEQHIDETQKAS